MEDVTKSSRIPSWAAERQTQMIPVREIYVSTDVESDGPIPGPNSMLSFGSVALRDDGSIVSTFSRNLETLPGASGDPDTTKWWSGQPEAWEACRKDLVPPEQAMRDYAGWVESLPGRPVFVAYPVSFDMTFMYWYLMRFVGKSYPAIDIRSFAMGRLCRPYMKTSKKDLPKQFVSSGKHRHIALDDALEQGQLFVSLLRAPPR